MKRDLWIGSREPAARDSTTIADIEGPEIRVPVGTVTHRVRLVNIRHITSDENYTTLALVRGERLLLRRTLREWTELLPGEQFFRVRRGLLLNLDGVARVEHISRAAVRLYFVADSPAPLDLSRRHWPDLRSRIEQRRADRKAALALRPVEKSVAVLPFVHLGTDAGGTVFCDGLSEELLNVLARIPGLRVAARTSSFFFKGKNLPITEIGRQLGVEQVIEGSVRQSATHVRVTAQLIDVASGFRQWSASFDRPRADVFALQDEIARLIATRLEVAGGPRSRTTAVVSPAARWSVLEGRHFWNLRTAESFVRAEEAYLRALAYDPRCAPAHAGLADLCVVRGMYRLADGAREAAEDLTRARHEARRALELDPNLAEPHAALGFALFHEGRLKEAEEQFPHAFAINPNYATGYQFYAWTLCGTGQMARALSVYERAIGLDPLSFINLDRYAALLVLGGRFAEALAVNERAAVLRPDVFVGNLSQRAPILLALGRTEQAIATARAVLEIGQDVPYRRNSDSDALFVLHQTGHTAEAAETAAVLLERFAPDNYLRGFILSAIGRLEEALPSLRHAPPIMLPQLYWSRLWDDVRETAPFQQLIRDLGRREEYAVARAVTG